MTNRPPENLPFTTVREAIEVVKELIPRDIQARYLYGEFWENLEQSGMLATDTIIDLGFGPRSFKLYLGAYLINLVVQSLFSELAMEQKVNPDTGVLETLDEADMNSIKATINVVIEFVQRRLGVFVDIDPEIRLPHVQIGGLEDDTSRLN